MQLGLTPVTPSDDARVTGVIRSLTVVGTVSYIGWALWLFQQLYQTSQVGASRTAGIWEERIEAIGFMAFPPNLALLALPAAAAATATWLAGPTQQLGLAILLRLTRWSATGLVAVAVASTLETILGRSGGIDQVDSIAFRVGGGLIAGAIAYLCLEAGRTAPGG